MKLAFSPCPNDTFLFHAFVKNLVGHSFELDVMLADIQHLNQRALDSVPDVSKISFFTLGKVLQNYCLLPVGSALGQGNGPKIVSSSPHKIEDMELGTLAIPGRDTTAYLLYRLLLPHARVERFCRYNEIPQLMQKRADFGLVIHETRFNLEKAGLYEVCDLGELWKQKTGLPLPLGCLVAKRNLGKETLKKLCEALVASYDYAKQNPSASAAYVMEHAEEKDPDIIQAHIDLYVNEETRNLSDKGLESIHMLLEEGFKAKLLPKIDPARIFS
jgi:1,4-dihydroxy-6-naphthoate synthase